MSVTSTAKDHDKKDSINQSDEVLRVSVLEGESLSQSVETTKHILAPRIQYSREELMLYKESPFSSRSPHIQDPALPNVLLRPNSRGVWNPSRGHLERKRSETPPDDRSRGDLALDSHKRRSVDPKERLRKEQDGIVLSPQRGNFDTGCYVASSQSSGRRPESPLNKFDRDRDMSHRKISNRHIGSGRIPTKDMWDYRVERSKDPDSASDMFLQRGSGSMSRERSDDRFERRPFGRDMDRNKDRHRNDDRSRYGGDRRRAYSDSREEEPEWVSGGPTSQHDTIELRGFDAIPEEQSGPRGNAKKQLANQNKNSKTTVRTNTGSRKLSDPTPPQSASTSTTSITSSGVNSSSSSGPGGRSTPTPGSAAVVLPPASQSPIIEKTAVAAEKLEAVKSPTPTTAEESTWQKKEEIQPQPDFNLEDIFKSDAITGLLTNGTSSEGQAGSRFSQWFHRDSPVKKADESSNHQASLQVELNNMISDITEPNIMSSLSDSNTYFAPISPAANTASVVGSGVSVSSVTTSGADGASGNGNVGSIGTKNIQLLEMLQRGGHGDAAVGSGMKAHTIRDLEAVGKVYSVEELEARMRQGINASQNTTNNLKNMSTSSKKTEEDIAAFNKLLAQVKDGKANTSVSNGPNPQKSQPLNFLQMLSKSQEAAATRQETRQMSSGMGQQEQVLNSLGGFGVLGQQVNISQVGSQHAPPPPPPPTHQQQQQQMQIPQDLVMKLLQVRQQQQQQEMLTKLLAGQQSQQQQQQQQPPPAQSTSHLGPYQVPPPPSLSPLPPELQMMVSNAQPSLELLQRPEAQAILRGIRFGEITPQHLVQQLQNPAMQLRHREVLVSILKMQMQQAGVSPRTSSPHHVPQPELLHQMMLQRQQQQHQQQQLRIPSPLNSAYCQPPPVISPNMATNPNTLAVQHPVLPHRVPSPRELIVHTQNIMQSALIKKKLEEQKENYRKRQEMQHCDDTSAVCYWITKQECCSRKLSASVESLSPNVTGGMSTASGMGGTNTKMGESSPAKHMSSPTPLAFTPTSVLRKMTAEKESETTSIAMSGRNDIKTSVSNTEQMKQQTVAAQQSHLRQQTGIPPMRPQQPSGVAWNVPKQHQGRPIVKGNSNFQYVPSVDYQQQQQQRHNAMMGAGGGYNNNMQRSMTMATLPSNMSSMPQPYNSLMMMQHRPPPTMNPSATRAPTHQASLQQSQQRNLPQSLQLLLNQNYNNTGRNAGKSDSRMGASMRQHSQPMPIRHGQNMNMMGNKDLSTSPTSNQLAQWFSPELLAQARAGQLPDMPPIPSTQNMLSLEELERLQQNSAVVHN